MTFRAKLFFVFTLALLVSIGVIVAGATINVRKSIEQLNAEHTDALVAQFQQEVDRRKAEVLTRVHGVAEDSRSEERRVGKECRTRRPPMHQKKRQDMEFIA